MLDGQVTVELTTLFADDVALRAAYTEALSKGVSPDAIVKGWCRLAKLALQTGDHTKFVGKINNVSKRVPIDAKVYSTVAFRVLENAGMITVSDAEPIVREVTDEDFEIWWKSYPKRLTNNVLVRKGKVQAKTWFARKIITKANLARLIAATTAYEKATNPKFVSDAERFLRHDTWKDFTEVAEQIKIQPAEVGRTEIDKMMGVTSGDTERQNVGTSATQ
jgi:hypothetical protein